ncbi:MULTISPECIES: NAD(P)-dependent oxidoreductase [unclassified Janthinobacterium]|uniref:NAD-dependent epimerase/dehydratase family protein n=1 Tax=unclassified Janthinobacterium TaxID=2610881 RepID=UPI00161735CA|nr:MULTISPECIES: NAD(P)-dependent oxidoreductase [unclassified Janthinobacterium]MBB5610474.1 nucleoside-diphosphate-sugar epimerase [Janthinobacterium sp. S3T4]MBB5615864.1 nucleoside-diphosphate-sugar epimerase [Janthinobacterium sp. S3M3]
MRRILVTGATGGLGRNAVQTLLAQGVDVRATGRNLAVGLELERMGAQFVPLDLALATPQQVDQLVRGMDAVWHCAALSSPWGAERDFIAANVTATGQLLRAAGSLHVAHFVHISTPAMYFDYRNRYEVPETFRPETFVNAYARSKAMAEKLVQDAAERHPAMRCVILRPRAIFGPHDQVLIPRLARVLTQRGGKLPLPHGGAVTLDITYVDNVVHAMWLATTHKNLQSGAAFNITNGEPARLCDILRSLFCEHLQQPFEIIKVPYRLLALAARAMQFASRFTRREPSLTPYSIGALSFDMTLDNAKARKVLGYQPIVSLQEGIARTAQWMRQEAAAVRLIKERNG